MVLRALILLQAADEYVNQCPALVEALEIPEANLPDGEEVGSFGGSGQHNRGHSAFSYITTSFCLVQYLFIHWKIRNCKVFLYGCQKNLMTNHPKVPLTLLNMNC